VADGAGCCFPTPIAAIDTIAEIKKQDPLNKRVIKAP